MIYLYIILLFVSCTRKPEIVGTVIQGENLSIPDGVVYLTTMEKKALLIDSTSVKEGKFKFSFEKKTEPFRACLGYRDKSGKIAIVRFVKNDPKEPVEVHSSLEYFVVESGRTLIKGVDLQNGEAIYASVTNAFENILLFQPGYDLLGFAHTENELAYEASIDAIKEDVKKNPTSILLFERIYYHRADFKKSDLAAILSLAEPKIKETTPLLNLHNYVKNLYDEYDPLNAIPLISSTGGFEGNYDQKARLNMLIFSCVYIHPSELFLFYLEKSQREFKRKGLYVADIDLTEVESFWEGKLKNITHRNWVTLHATKEKRHVIINRHNIPEFPLIVFTDEHGRELERFQGYHENTIDLCKNFVDNYLAE